MKQKQILICTLENPKRKIYFDLDTKTYGSVVDTDRNASVGIIAGGSTLFYVLFRHIQNNFSQPGSLLFWYSIFTILGIAVGTAFVYLKNKKATRIFLKKLTLDEDDLNEYLDLGESQLSDSRTTIFVCLFAVAASMFNVFYAHLSVILILVTPLWVIIIYLIDYFDFSRRGKVLKELKKKARE